MWGFLEQYFLWTPMSRAKQYLALDMTEQVLKFTSSAEKKRAVLDEHCVNIESLAMAACFLYEISKINPHRSSSPAQQDDRFLPVIREFHAKDSFRCAE
ncbi:hypothetical protein DOY81_013264 [Sarcophaga bullata]|nr:hypothetical protein DOY81_013264 [Sarcophaga bullata]